jgi:iron(III) transport system ATP-binding protein
MTRHAAPLRVQGLSKCFGAATVLAEADLDVAAGSTCVLLGPSGSGKTTLLRTIAGLERPDAGTIALGDTVLTGPSTFVAPERRHIGMVFQDGALFPHLSVAANVAYGLRRAERRGARVAETLAMVGLEGCADRLPGTLSGGQQQRVALARALAPRPSVLLLDEPFSNLDAALRAQVRSDVHRVLAEAGVTALFVTHDQEEAFVLGDEVAVMHNGRIVQQASPAELYRRPVDSWTARFVGDANLVAGTAHGELADTMVGPVPLAVAREGAVEVLVRPEHLHVERAADGCAVVELVEYYGHDAVLLLHVDRGETLKVRVVHPLVRRGDRVAMRYAGPAAVAYPLDGCASTPVGARPDRVAVG